MISASHNPYEDNGIKMFSKDGFKLSDDREFRLESDHELIENHGHSQLPHQDKESRTVKGLPKIISRLPSWPNQGKPGIESE